MVSLNDLVAHVAFGTALLPQCCPSSSLVCLPRIPVCPSWPWGPCSCSSLADPVTIRSLHAGPTAGAVSLVGDMCASSRVQGV